MKTFKNFFYLIVIFTFIFNYKIFSQDVVKCNTYETFYSTIKSGNAASYNKWAFMNDLLLFEKSIITVYPQALPDTGFKVIIKIKDIMDGDNKDNKTDPAILASMVSGCDEFRTKYEKFNNTSCSFIADCFDDVKEVTEQGITLTIDLKYTLEGSLVDTYKKMCASHKPKPVKKPAVYLYPEKEMNVSVKVEVNGKLTLSDPPYNTGWEVTASPNGIIDNKYDYLFYEADLNKIDIQNEGWVVEFSSLEKWFNEYLPLLGLNEKEKEQFKEYWLKDLKNANYYEIKILDDKFLSENMKLIVTPEPQTLIRLNFYFKPVFTKTELKEPVISKKERKGFTVVEWGGINEGDKKIFP